MQKRKIWENFLQWILPCVLLVIALALNIYDFNNEMDTAIQTVVDNQVEQIGLYYAAGVEDKLNALENITDAVASIMASRPDRSDAFLNEKLDTLMKASDAYMAAYCAANGTGYLNDRRQIDMTELNYYDSILGESPHYLFARDDGINGQTAFIYVCPVTNSGNVTGYLLSYMEPVEMSDLFENSVYGNQAFFSLVNRNGTIMASYGATEQTTILRNDFWNSLKDVAESLGNWTLFERQQQKGNSGILHVKENGIGKILCHFPIADTDWNLVVGIDESYLSGVQQSFRRPIVNLILKISISIAVALIIITAINILVRIKASEHSKVLEDKADTDLLTDLNNKMATERKIREYMEKYPDKQGVLFVLDVDNFKKINDTMGHAFGDEVLRSLAVRLQSMFRATDIVGRTGGDEFMVFLKDIREISMIEREGKKIEQFFHQFEVGEYVKYSVTASVGAAVFPGDGKSFEELYKAADNALYVSKRHGKNQLSFYKKPENETK